MLTTALLMQNLGLDGTQEPLPFSHQLIVWPRHRSRVIFEKFRDFHKNLQSAVKGSPIPIAVRRPGLLEIKKTQKRAPYLPTIPLTMLPFRRNRTGSQRQGSISSTGITPPLQNAASMVGISSTEYSRKCRELMELYRDLVALGLVTPLPCTSHLADISARRAKTIFDLPRVVVIGGQSSM